MAKKKPDQFKEYEDAAKSILEAQETDYYEWLHNQHKKLVESVVVTNPKLVGLLIGEKKGVE
ncbi:hypothetical protein [Bacillus smithii]|uniref:hypothetical protein n=1 Tax=Bacillus smithii TaxID=1479 RepID=UPI00077BFCDF|nr:hypothetical protein [Bacillus smithii]MED4882763.1 hypothetical protein [Bacillus smithii]MED4928431.1 hypothetical protein [Bacillus smithii]